MFVEPGDLSAVARIRYAALEGFALNGTAATSIRDVARRANVSPGLVQHHFKNKAGLRQAVDDYVIRLGADAFGSDGPPDDGGDTVQLIGDRITAWMRDHPLALLYIVRSVTEGDPSGVAIFDSLVAVGNDHIERLASAGLLREDLDRRWAVLQVIILNLATALLEPVINRHLEAPLRTPDQLGRWNRACTELFRHGLFNPTGLAAQGRTHHESGKPGKK